MNLHTIINLVEVDHCILHDLQWPHIGVLNRVVV